MYGLVLAASMIVSPPGENNRFVVPQDSMAVCQFTAEIWSLEWRNTEFMCVPNTLSEQNGWFPKTIGPKGPK